MIRAISWSICSTVIGNDIIQPRSVQLDPNGLLLGALTLTTPFAAQGFIDYASQTAQLSGSGVTLTTAKTRRRTTPTPAAPTDARTCFRGSLRLRHSVRWRNADGRQIATVYPYFASIYRT